MSIKKIVFLFALASVIYSQDGYAGCSACIFDGRYVCAKNGKTYPNTCFAECVGFVVNVDFIPGICAKPCDCVDIYSPVCSSTGRTFRNKCMAECVGAVILKDTACRCDCDNYKQPVCGNDQVTYLNDCHASCAGVGVLYLRACEEHPSIKSFPDFADKFETKKTEVRDLGAIVEGLTSEQKSFLSRLLG